MGRRYGGTEDWSYGCGGKTDIRSSYMENTKLSSYRSRCTPVPAQTSNSKEDRRKPRRGLEGQGGACSSGAGPV